MTTRKELTDALRARYRSATFGDRIKILDEFVALTGYHRKHAIRVLGEKAADARAIPVRNRLYDESVRQALTMLWEAANRVCGKRLKALIMPKCHWLPFLVWCISGSRALSWFLVELGAAID